MTPESTTPVPTVQRPVLRCVVGQERGRQCLPVVPGSIYCHNHHPDRREEQSRRNSRAAKASHTAARPDPELEAWAETLDFSTKEARERGLAEAARLVAKGSMTPAQGNTIAALARAADIRLEAPARKKPVVVIAKYGRDAS